MARSGRGEETIMANWVTARKRIGALVQVSSLSGVIAVAGNGTACREVGWHGLGVEEMIMVGDGTKTDRAPPGE